MVVADTISASLQTFLKGSLGTLVGEAIGDVISDYDIKAFKEAKSKQDVAKIALTRGLGRLTSAVTMGGIHAGDIDNYRKTGSLKQTLLKKNLLGLALTGAAIAMPQFAVGFAAARRLLPEITAEDVGKAHGGLRDKMDSRLRQMGFSEEDSDPEEDQGTTPPPQTRGFPGEAQPAGGQGFAGEGATATASPSRALRQDKTAAKRAQYQGAKGMPLSMAKVRSTSADGGRLDEDGEQGLEAGRAQVEAKRKRQLNIDRKRSQAFRKKGQAAMKKQAQVVAKKVAGKAGLKIVSAAFGATGIGLIVSHSIMTFQLFAGNLMRSKVVPKLNGLEIAIWACGTFLLMGVILILIIAGNFFQDPWKTGIMLLQETIDRFKEWVVRLFS